MCSGSAFPISHVALDGMIHVARVDQHGRHAELCGTSRFCGMSSNIAASVATTSVVADHFFEGAGEGLGSNSHEAMSEIPSKRSRTPSLPATRSAERATRW